MYPLLYISPLVTLVCFQSRWVCFCFVSKFICTSSEFLMCFSLFTYWPFLWHVESPFPHQGSNSHPLHQKHGVSTTGLPGKSSHVSVVSLYNGIMQCGLLSSDFPPLGIIIWRSTHAVAGNNGFFLFVLSTSSLHGHPKTHLRIYLLMDIWAGFQYLSVRNEATRGVCAQVFVWTWTSIYLERQGWPAGETARSKGRWMFISLRNSLFTIMIVPFHVRTDSSLPGGGRSLGSLLDLPPVTPKEESPTYCRVGWGPGCPCGPHWPGKGKLCLITSGQAWQPWLPAWPWS